jgi:hypothetical protein
MGDNIKMHLEEIGYMGVWWINSPQDTNEWWGFCEHDTEPLGSIKCRECLPGNVNFATMALRHLICYVTWPTWLRPRISPSWEASSRPATQQIALLLYKHNTQMVPILSHMCSINNLPRYNVMYTLILSFHLLSGLSNDPSPSCFITTSIYTFLMIRMHATNPTQIQCPWYNHILKAVIK